MNEQPNLYREPQAEAAFRAWQQKHYACLMTNWTCSMEKTGGMSFDRFCLHRYTGRLTFNLR